jgi:hypothetical protein
LTRPKKSKKYIYFCTGNDNPYQGQNLERTAIILKSMDLVHAQISLQIIGLNFEKEFKFDSYYKQLNYFKYTNDPENRFEQCLVENEFKEFKDLLYTRDANQRVAFNAKLNLDGIEIGVKGYRQFVEKRKPSHKLMDPVTSTQVESKTIYMDAVSLID